MTTLEFGPDGASPAHHLTDPVVFADPIKDVNNDSIEDLASHYRTQDTGIQCGDSSASLTGKSIGGQPIDGSDSIKSAGCE